MTVIATAVRHLLAAGVTGDALVQAIADMEAAQPKDAAAERRRAWDRERKRKARDEANSGGSPVESADIAEIPSLSPAPLPSPQTPQPTPHPHTHPDISTPCARKADPFPRPDWCEDRQHWTDLKANRKAKRLPNTPTAYTKFIRDIAQWVDDDWPPGRVLEAIVARGWASAQYDPRESSPNGNHIRPSSPSSADRRSGLARAIDEQLGSLRPFP